MSPEKFERVLVNALVTAICVFGVAIGIWFTYLVLLYSFS